MRVEPTFVHIAETSGTTESRFGALYKTKAYYGKSHTARN